MEKPDVDSIEGLSPAISIDQKTTSRNPRSTVGTVTEIYDYLRLLWARIGTPHCPSAASRSPASRRADRRSGDGAAGGRRASWCSRRSFAAARASTASSSRSCARGLHPGQGRRRAAPARRGDRARQEVQARHRGRRRPARDEGRPAQAARGLDRDGGGLADGLVEVELVDHAATQEHPIFSEQFACPERGTSSLAELEPRIFSFNSPHGACPRCTGLGSQLEIDPELVVPDPTLSIGEGAIAPWARARRPTTSS